MHIGTAMLAAMSAATSSVAMSCVFGSANLLIATTAPFLALSSASQVSKLRVKLMVSIAPMSTKNPWSPSFLVMCMPSIAACALPSPGSMLTRKPAVFPAKSACIVGPFFSCIFLLSFCFGITVFCCKLYSKVATPNNPLKRGNNGSSTTTLFNKTRPIRALKA